MDFFAPRKHEPQHSIRWGPRSNSVFVSLVPQTHRRTYIRGYFRVAIKAARPFTSSGVRLFKLACFGEVAITFWISSAVLPLIEGDFIAGLPAASAPWQPAHLALKVFSPLAAS